MHSRYILAFAVFAFTSAFAPFAFAGEDNDPHVTGCRPPTAEEDAWYRARATHIRKVRMNDLARQRVNAHRRAKGLAESARGEVAPMGEEIVSATGTGSDTSEMTLDAEAVGALPVAVNNTHLKYFPPVSTQGSQGSCACFSTTYYQMTHMTGLARDFDNKASSAHRFSPAWTYNMINNGGDNGSWPTSAHQVMRDTGCATLGEFPYYTSTSPSTNYTRWCLDGNVWRNAINYRLDAMGTIAGVDTDAGMGQLKQLLVNGYVVTFATNVYGWQFKTIGNNAAGTADDPYVGWKIASYCKANQGGGHAMTVAGYNDEIWCDVNSNGTVDTGELGALLIVNSWGTGWNNGGMCWLAYDALKLTSAVAGAPTDREATFWHKEVYWITAKPSYTPTMVATFTVNHAKRNQMTMKVGKSATSTTTPSTLWTAAALSGDGGALAFNGTTTACDGTFCLDMTGLAPDPSVLTRYYLGMTDSSSGAETGTIKSFNIVDVAGGNVVKYAANVPQTANANTVYAYTDYSSGGQTAPAAPTNLVASAASASQINLTWTDNAGNETGFKIERKTGVAGTWAQIATTGASVTSYSSAGLNANTLYVYRVRATNAVGDSAYSNEASATTKDVLPAAPTSLVASTASTTQINLTWNDNANNETGFKIERKTGTAGTWAQIATTGANVTSYSNTGLSANTLYVYRVRATNAVGDSAYSNEASATTNNVVPTAPTTLVASAVSASQINLTWIDKSGNETGFKIERKTGAAGTWAQIATTGANVTSYGNTGLVSNTLYVYRVRAYNTIGNSAYSNEASATTGNNPPTIQLTAPANGASFKAPATVALTATASDSDGSILKVEFFSGATKLGEDTLSPYSYSWTNVAAGSYSLVAKATDSNGATATSAAVSITVKAEGVIGNGNGLLGEYFDDQFFATPKLCRTDATVDFAWGTGSPASVIAADTFSVQWSGQIQAQYTETYTVTAQSDDGVRLWIGGNLIVDNWTDHAPTENSATIAMVAGQKYDIRMTYYENGGGAVAKLLWSSSSTAKQVVPQSQLYSSPLRTPENPTGTVNGLDYAYYQGTWDLLPNFSALTPVKTGTVSDFNLGARTQNDSFGFRFTGFVEAPYDGSYTFYTNSDDGSRLYIGSTLVVDNDGLHAMRERSGTIGLKAGKHALTVVFFEKTGGEGLSVSWSGPAIGKQLVPVGRLYRVAPANGDGLLATYFNNVDLTGTTATRIDATINFDWGRTAPISGFGVDTYSVRWTGYVVPPASGSYTFTARTDDGVRLWINGVAVIDFWQLRSVAESSGTVTLNAGQRYSIKMEYYNSPGYGVAQLYWTGPGIARQIVPQKHLYSK